MFASSPERGSFLQLPFSVTSPREKVVQKRPQAFLNHKL